jgi:hypothetical protein
MPPRLNKRQLREQEELFALRPTEGEEGLDFDDEEMSSAVETTTMVRFMQVLVQLGS